LRQALVARDAPSPVLDRRGHPGHHQVDERVVTQERRERHAEPPPIDAVEEVVDVGLVHEAAAACVGGPDGARRAMAGAAPAVAMAPVRHQLVERRGEDLGDRPLGHPVEIGGHGQRAWFAVRAFEHEAPEGRRTVAAREQPFREARQSILGGLLLARLFLGRGVLVFPGISLPLVSILTARLIFTSGLARVDGLVGEEEIGPLAGAPEEAHARLGTGAGPIPVLGLEPVATEAEGAPLADPGVLAEDEQPPRGGEARPGIGRQLQEAREAAHGLLAALRIPVARIDPEEVTPGRWEHRGRRARQRCDPAPPQEIREAVVEAAQEETEREVAPVAAVARLAAPGAALGLLEEQARRREEAQPRFRSRCPEPGLAGEGRLVIDREVPRQPDWLAAEQVARLHERKVVPEREPRVPQREALWQVQERGEHPIEERLPAREGQQREAVVVPGPVGDAPGLGTVHREPDVVVLRPLEKRAQEGGDGRLVEEPRRGRRREGERDDHGPERQQLVDGQGRRGRAGLGARFRVIHDRGF